MLVFESCLLASFTFYREVCQAYELSVGVTHLHLKWPLPLWFSGHGLSSLTVAQGDTLIYVGNSTLPSFNQ